MIQWQLVCWSHKQKRETKSNTKYGNGPCDWFILQLLLPDLVFTRLLLKRWLVRAESEVFIFVRFRFLGANHSAYNTNQSWGVNGGFSIIAGFSLLFVVTTISHQNVWLVWIKFLYCCYALSCVVFYLYKTSVPSSTFPFSVPSSTWYRRGSCSVTMFETAQGFIHEGMCLLAWLFLNPPSEV